MTDELLNQFLIEASELVQQGSDALLALERDPQDRALMDDAFRAIHTLKGSVGLFDLLAMGACLHAAEDVLGAVRSGVRAPDATTIDALLAVLTQVERWLGQIEIGRGLPEDAGLLARRLEEQLNTGLVTYARSAPDGDVPQWASTLRKTSDHSGRLTAIRYSPAEDAYFSGDDPIGLLRALPQLLHLKLAVAGDAEPDAYDPFACRLIIEALTADTVADVRAVLRFVPDQVEIVALPDAVTETVIVRDEADLQAGVRTLRVDAGRMEGLGALVDELVAARTALAALSSQAKTTTGDVEVARGLATQSERLDRLTDRMRREVTALRMTPVAPLLRRFPRLARELARTLGKEVDLVVQDNGIEADKTIVDGVFEPLMHLLRNAIDHGIEAPDVRDARGKRPKGTLELTAKAEAGRLHLTLADDGAGIEPAAIRAAAVAKGLQSPEAVSSLDDSEALNLIFLPGFSTARALTDVSGRGVGMDAVKTAVQRMGGHIEIDSRFGTGTTVHITLPLSLTLTKVMVVISGGELYGLPIDQVVETLRVPAARITSIRAGQAFDWRDRTTPLLNLAALVGGSVVSEGSDRLVLVIRSGTDVFGVVVDAIKDRADVVVRPLEGLLAGMTGISGTTVLGDGQVLMVLDPETLIR